MLEVLCEVLHRLLCQVKISVRVGGGKAFVGQTRNVKLFQEGHGVGRQNLLDPLVCPTRALPPSNVGHLELPQVLRPGQEVRQVGQTDPGQLEMLQVDEGDRVAVEEGHVLLIDVEDIVGGLLDTKALKVGARIDEPGKVEVVGRDELERLDRLPHVGDVGRVLSQGDVQLAGDAVDQLDVLGVREDVSEVAHYAVYAHLNFNVICSQVM